MVQLLQVAGVTKYPWDAILIFGFSLAIALPFLLAMLALHYATPRDKQLWTHGALLFGAIYTVYAALMYAVQLGVAIPMSFRGAPESVLTNNPHSLFWTIDALAYIFMGFATFFAVPALTEPSVKWLKWFFLANGLVTPLVAFVYFFPHFSVALLVVGLPWAITAPGSMLILALWFRFNIIEVKHDAKDSARLRHPVVAHLSQH